MRTVPRFGPVLALAAFAFILGYNWVVMKVGVSDIPAFVFAAARALLGATTLFLILVVLRRSLRPPEIRHTIVAGLLQTTAMVGLATWAVVSAPPGKTAVLVNSMPLWIPLFALPILGEKIGLRWTAIALGVLGLVLMIDPRHGMSWLSDLAAVCAALCWAAAIVVTKHLQRNTAFDPLSFTAWQVLFGSLPLIAIAIAPHPGPLVLTTPALLAVAYNGILATGLAFVLFAYAMKSLSVTVAGAGGLSIPVIGVAAAWFQVGERPSGLEWAGMACILGALALMASPLRGLASHERLLGLLRRVRPRPKRAGT
jgi:drug/metabolite transporter (DMT)-like permease